MTAGAIAGIAFGALGGMFGILGGLWIFWKIRRPQPPKPKTNEEGDKVEGCWYVPDDEMEHPPDTAESSNGKDTMPEIMSHELLELHDEQLRHQLMSSQIYELDGHPFSPELEPTVRRPTLSE